LEDTSPLILSSTFLVKQASCKHKLTTHSSSDYSGNVTVEKSHHVLNLGNVRLVTLNSKHPPTNHGLEQDDESQRNHICVKLGLGKEILEFFESDFREVEDFKVHVWVLDFELHEGGLVAGPILAVAHDDAYDADY
jgi:hypothetical protein